jgi:hypothetical protein
MPRPLIALLFLGTLLVAQVTVLSQSVPGVLAQQVEEAPTPPPVPTATPVPPGPDRDASTYEGVFEDDGIQFSSPIVLGTEAASVFVPVRNDNTEPRSFGFETWFYANGQPVQILLGSAPDILPGRTALIPLRGREGIPAAYDQVGYRIHVMARTDGRTEELKNLFALSATRRSETDPESVELDVTNADRAQHTAVIQLIYWRDGDIIAIGTGTAEDLDAGATEAVVFKVNGDRGGFDLLTSAILSIVYS